jgi:uncharacterized protein (TIGR02646 family)
VIRRPLPPVPPALDGPESKGGKELARARAHFGNAATAGESFTFSAYKDDEVKDALNAAFELKCAYCESFFGATQPLDVEHFRPKGGVEINGSVVPRLYFWLAAAWGNLLPSCIDCNRRRTQNIVGVGVAAAGKLNQFPIADEDKRARAEGDERTEPRLLLHPSLDRPERHLSFDDAEGIVSAKRSPSGRVSVKGEASIHVFALRRDGLVRARKARQKLIRKEIALARKLALKLDADGSDPVLEELLADSLTMLRDYMAPEAPYAGMARQLIEPVIEELTG